MRMGIKLKADPEGSPAERKRAAVGWKDVLAMQEHLEDQRCKHCEHIRDWLPYRCGILRLATGSLSRCDRWEQKVLTAPQRAWLFRACGWVPPARFTSAIPRRDGWLEITSSELRAVQALVAAGLAEWSVEQSLSAGARATAKGHALAGELPPPARGGRWLNVQPPDMTAHEVSDA